MVFTIERFTHTIKMVIEKRYRLILLTSIFQTGDTTVVKCGLIIDGKNSINLLRHIIASLRIPGSVLQSSELLKMCTNVST